MFPEWPNRPLTAEEAGIRPPPLRPWDDKRRIANVLVAEHVKGGVAFLGQKNARGQFIPHGTAFFVGLIAHDQMIPYIVTAKHVIDQIPVT